MYSCVFYGRLAHLYLKNIVITYYYICSYVYTKPKSIDMYEYFSISLNISLKIITNGILYINPKIVKTGQTLYR